MDREALKRVAKARRAQSDCEEGFKNQKKTPEWKCDYCSRSFKHEKVFMKHVCPEKLRIDEMKSPLGQSAYAYYGEWMRISKRSVPPIETFIHSSFYTTFIKFAKHVLRVNMPAPQNFIRMMVGAKVMPTLWCRDNVYAMYMKSFDEAMPPEEQFMQSIEFLLSYAESEKLSIEDVFGNMGVEKFLLNVQKRKLSPWFLAASSVFRTWIKSLDSFDATRVEDSVKVGALMIRISSNDKQSSMFGEFCRTCREFNL